MFSTAENVKSTGNFHLNFLMLYSVLHRQKSQVTQQGNLAHTRYEGLKMKTVVKFRNVILM